MAATQSTMMPLGTIAPDFLLYDVMTGDYRSLKELRGDKGTVIMFVCNHCPYVQYLKGALAAMCREYRSSGIRFVAISSNDISQYPEDGPDEMKKMASDWENPFDAYLFDETQSVAKAYHAVCTPDFFVFNHLDVCVYRGRFDNATPRNSLPVTGEDIRVALDALLGRGLFPVDQMPSIGCNIKWKI